MARVRTRNRPATIREASRAATRMSEAWGGRKVGEIHRGDVKAQIDLIGGTAPVAANRFFSFARSFFGFCQDYHLKGEPLPVLEISPCAAIRAASLYEEVSRDRVLIDSEIRALWTATAGLDAFDRAFRVLLLTGQRLREVSAMRWSELRLESSPTWELPAERCKNKRSHLVPLSPAVLDLLSERVPGCDFVFTINGQHEIRGFQARKKTLDAAMGTTPWTTHDLRRTCVTGMANIGIQPHVIEACVNHLSGAAKAGVAGIYNRATYILEKRAALELWADRVARLTGGNIVHLRAKE